MSDFTSSFLRQCKEAKIDLVTSVPDGYLVPLIAACQKDSSITHIEAAREEECLGIAAGASMTGKRAMVMMQNVGFMNAIGCYSTLCANYRTPFLILISHRGNLYDKNKYDIEKYRYADAFFKSPQVYSVSWREFRDEQNIIGLTLERAYTATEPAFLLLDFIPPEGSVC
jgi:sulfopyruvate decarboxylase subunit alpha